ncbi:MAG TPA: hypothetical protein PLT76_08280 [Candidatus Omnitrophota bacterium]|nr:hypothetical protein [Candidatus Omnitrophota bacterium]HPB67397.1 hypothetical protein [Candidatus Omnitrophota bacterium]HQO58697.1 hypothetical protein [Candidatus Omnitrophota bacterium]
MVDIILEILRTIIIGVILGVLFRQGKHRELIKIEGWRPMTIGFMLVFFGTLIDVTDNFESLNRFVVIGETPVQAFLEKVVGYLFGFIFLAIGISQWLPKIIEHNESVRKELQRAESKVKVLSGFLPICSACKKIRNDAGYWTQIEAYIRDHSEAEFSHSLCPECMKKLFPEYLRQENESAQQPQKD